MRLALLYNPSSGASRGEERARALASVLQARGHAVTVTELDRAGTCLAGVTPASCDVLIVQGGDGTLNAAVTGLALPGPPIAFFGQGTANVARRELRLPKSLDRFADVLEAGRTVEVAVARADEHAWLLFAEVGYQAEAVLRVNDTDVPAGRARRLRKMVVFGRAFLWALWSRHPELDVHLPGEPGPRRASNLLAFRTRFYGGRLHLPLGDGPAEPDFGILGVRTQRFAPRALILALAALRLLRRAAPLLERTGIVFVARADDLRIESVGDPTGAHVDAESLPAPPTRLHVDRSERVRLIVGPDEGGIAG